VTPLQVSTNCDTIIIYDSPKIFHDTDGTRIRAVAEAIELVDKIKPFKVVYKIYEHITAKSYGYLEMNLLITYNL
jgi:hypothetical protein